jgi:hypothetical protein
MLLFPDISDHDPGPRMSFKNYNIRIKLGKSKETRNSGLRGSKQVRKSEIQVRDSFEDSGQALPTDREDDNSNG